MTGYAVGRRGWHRARPWAGLALIAALAWPGVVPQAQESNAPVAAKAPAIPSTTAEARPAELTVGNRHVCTLRATSEYGADPAARVAGIAEQLQHIVERGGPLAVTTRPLDGAIAVVVDGQLLFRILPGDANRETAESPEFMAQAAVRNLTLALTELREGRDSRALLVATGKALLATLLLVVALWLLLKAYARVAARLRRFVHERSTKLVPAWGQHVVGESGIADVVVLPFKLLAWLLALLLIYQWTALVLAFFPYTRPWGEALGANLVGALGTFGSGVLHALPGLLFAALIFVVTRFIVKLVRAFFDGVQSGRIEIGWIDDATARPTGRLVIAVIWLFAFVAAYPYLPGSGSEAFKGIGVFVGLMMSIGASGVVNQAVSGLMLMYTRALRPGEFVQIGETEGTVTSVGFLTTRVETLRNVEVTIPNAVIAGNVTRNFSRLAGQGGVRVPTAVTIGYDTPWRQVQAMLQLAAARTQGLSAEPPPRVLQTALQDFYVEYTLIVTIADPRQRLLVLNDLHGHIQDVFNEYGVQIMSPNYEADPADKKFVPREQWYATPAQVEAPPPPDRSSGTGTSASVRGE